MERLGAANVGDDVLLAIILRSGTRGVNVQDLARGLLQRYGSFGAMAECSADEIAKIKGMGKVKAQVLEAALEIAKRLSEESTPERCQVKTPEDAARLLRQEVRGMDRENFWVLLLDTKNRLRKKPVNVSKGVLDASLVHPREVFKAAVTSATAAVVLVHNHPSGDPAPSAEDVRITRQLVEAGRVMDMKVLDHVILGAKTPGRETDYVSMREEGILEFE